MCRMRSVEPLWVRTRIRRAIELEAPFSGANDVWVTPEQGVTGGITTQGASIMKSSAALSVPEANVCRQVTRNLPPGVTEAKIAGPGQLDPRMRRVHRPEESQPVKMANSDQGASVVPVETTTVVPGTSVVEVVDNTPKSGKAITYGATVSTVTTVLTRSQARKRTPHELLPAMTIPKVSRAVPVAVSEPLKETQKVGSSPKGGRKEHTVGLLPSVDPEWMSTVARAQSADPFFGPLLRLGEQDRETLTLQERSRMKQFSVLEGLLFYTPQQGGQSRDTFVCTRVR